MNAINATLELDVAQANKLLIQKLWCIWFLTIGVFVFCLIFDTVALSISAWTAKYVPAIAKLSNPHAALNGFAGKYFGVITIFFPFMLICYIWKENIFLRFKASQPKTGRSLLETLVLIYCLGLPLLGFFLFIFYAAPFEMPVQPRLSGQHVLHLMINTYLGLFIFGTVLATFIPLFSALILGFLWLPFSAIYQTFLKGRIK